MEEARVWRPNMFIAAMLWAVVTSEVFGMAVRFRPVEKPPAVLPPPRCEIGYTLQVRDGIIEKKIPVVICQELNGKWILAKQ